MIGCEGDLDRGTAGQRRAHPIDDEGRPRIDGAGPSPPTASDMTRSSSEVPPPNIRWSGSIWRRSATASASRNQSLSGYRLLPAAAAAIASITSGKGGIGLSLEASLMTVAGSRPTLRATSSMGRPASYGGILATPGLIAGTGRGYPASGCGKESRWSCSTCDHLPNRYKRVTRLPWRAKSRTDCSRPANQPLLSSGDPPPPWAGLVVVGWRMGRAQGWPRRNGSSHAHVTRLDVRQVRTCSRVT